jgi:phage terminase large subunit GpA-like protein
VVDRFTIAGDTATEAPWIALEKLRTQREYRHEWGQHLDIRCLAIDTGYRFHVVLNWTRKKGQAVIAVKGGNANTPYLISQPAQVDVNHKGRKIARGALLWTVGTGRAKEELYSYLYLEPPLTADDPFPRGYCHFAEDLDDEFFQQLCAEELRPVKIRGFTSFKWEKIRDRNEALDEAVYARAAASLLGVDRWKPSDWDELERLLGKQQESVRPVRAAPSEDALPGAPQRWRPRRWRPGRRNN